MLEVKMARQAEFSRKQKLVQCGDPRRLHREIVEDCARLLMAIESVDPETIKDPESFRRELARRLGNVPWVDGVDSIRVNAEALQFRTKLAALQHLVFGWVEAARGGE